MSAKTEDLKIVSFENEVAGDGGVETHGTEPKFDIGSGTKIVFVRKG